MKIVHNSDFESNNRLFDLGGIIADLLPHGSGIDGDWEVQQDKSGNIYAFNSYTCYTEQGMLDSHADFYLKLKLVNMELHIIDFYFVGNKAQYLANKYDLRQYFDQLFFDSIFDCIQYNCSYEVLIHNL